MLRVVAGSAQYVVRYERVDSVPAPALKPLVSSFATRDAASAYLAALPGELRAQGYVTASVDSIAYDSSAASAFLFLGTKYTWASIRMSPADAALFEAVRWSGGRLPGTLLDFGKLRVAQEAVLGNLQETGYPFARIYLDSIALRDATVEAVLKVDRGVRYTIDSIRVYGEARVSNLLLQRWLGIPNGSIYNRKKLAAVDTRLSELVYVETDHPSDLTMLGSGAILNVYLKPRRNNQVNALIGFLPNPDAASGKKFQVAGEANILLRNALGGGETLGLNWQQLQQQSPRLNLLFEQPYFLKSAIGLGLGVEMLRKDTTFLNLLFNLSANYRIGRQVATVFLQRRQTIVNGINVAEVRTSRRLPGEGDVASNNLGVGYETNTTDYRQNPRSGTELFVTASAGMKELRKNNAVIGIKDPADPSFRFESLYDTVKLSSYQFRMAAHAARYFPVGHQATIRTAGSIGWYGSGQVYRNELFMIGGYKLLRGFDEESQYVSQYAVGTVEYRILLTRNSNVFAFTDGGWAKHPLAGEEHVYLSGGLGLSFEAKAGVFNIAVALGRRDDTGFNLRQSKVHLGFVSYF
jgi:outer membrane protein assembly factor BamA